MNAALETQGLCKSFGALAVASDISFRLEPGARHALIGPCLLYTSPSPRDS